MRDAGQLAILLLALVTCARSALADHDTMVMASSPETSSVSAGVAMTAASFGTPFYEGDYEGFTPALMAQAGRWSATAMLGLYRLQENGRTLYGPGDAMASASVTLVDRGGWHAGATFGATAPTGDMATGLGMGHVMLMPSVWATRGAGPLMLAAAVGYDRAIANLAEHQHGAWPLVDPMNMQEVAWSASATLPITRAVSVSARGDGGVPFDIAMGVDRVALGGAATWMDGTMLFAAVVQAGVLGDPYRVRAVVQTQVTF